MKKILAAVLLCTTVTMAQAHGPARAPSYHHHGGHHAHWVGPLILGGVVGYALSRPAPVYSYPAPVYSYPAPVMVPPPEPMPSWAPPVGYHYEQRLDPGCRCWRWFVVSDTPAY